ncbi:fungal specific transcription factor domain-containing protein [Aspergillus stella-maris]|uniref:fungal specific transcription factor domain-containing protein n=1 Tax=Aspergillus stella-maris TaxID=1810926 RepID=UPI003CCDA217
MFLSPRTFFLFVCLQIQFFSLIALSSAAVRVGSEETYFTHPVSSDSDPSSEEELSYELRSIQEVSWVTDLDVFNISIWQRGDNGASSTKSSSGGLIFAKTEESDPVTTISWVVQTYSFELDTSSVFYLAIEGDSDSNEYTSADFNITSSSSLSSSSSKNSTIPSSAETPTSSSSDDSSSSAATSSSTSLTSTGKIALGLGVGIGAPLISLLAILAYFQYRTIRRQNYLHPDLHPHPHPRHHGHGHTDSVPYPQTPHGHYSHNPSMTGGFYPSPPPIDQQQQHHHLQIPLPPSILPPSPIPTSGSLYRTANTEPSELPQKLAKPVHLPPWEVHSESVTLTPTPPSSTSMNLDGLGVLPATSDKENSQQAHSDTPPDDTAPFVGETSMAHTLKEVENRFRETHTGYPNTSERSSQPCSPSVSYTPGGKEDSGDQSNRVHHALEKHGIVADRAKWDQYLQEFINGMHVLYPILHLPILQDNYDEAGNVFDKLTPSDHDALRISQILICLAIGRCTSASRGGPEEVRHSSGWSLYSAAMDILGGEAGLFSIVGSPLTFLQTLVLIVIYLLRLDANERASKVAAMLVSHAHHLGLHRDKALTRTSTFEHEMYRRLWWCIYILDRQVALETGLPFIIQDMNVDTRLSSEPDKDKPDQAVTIPDDLDSKFSPSEASPTPYLVCTTRYSKVLGKVWEALYKARESRQEDAPPDGLTQEYLEHLISSAQRETPNSLAYDINKSLSDQIEGLEHWQVRQKALLHFRWTFLRLCIRRPMLQQLSSSSSFTSGIHRIENELNCMKLAQNVFQQFEALYDQYPKFEFPFSHYLARTTMISLGLIIKRPSLQQGYGEQTLRMARLIKSLCRQTWVSGKFARSVVALNRMAEAMLGETTVTEAAADDRNPKLISALGLPATDGSHESGLSSATKSGMPEPQTPHITAPAPTIPVRAPTSGGNQVSQDSDILSPNLLDLVVQDFDFERAFAGQAMRLNTHSANLSATPYPLTGAGLSSIGAPHGNDMPEIHIDSITADAGDQAIDVQPDLQALNMDWVQELLGAGFHPDPFTLW